MTHQPPPRGFRTFLYLWATQSISVIGAVITFFATTIWLAKSLYPLPGQKPELAWALSSIGLARMLPFIVFSPLAGAWADRHDRKRTMIAMDAVNAVLCLAWVALLISGRMGLPALLALTVLSALAGAYHYSAFDSSYAMLVSAEQLPRANGMMQTAYSLSNIIGPGIAAAIYAVPSIARKAAMAGALGHFAAAQRDGMPLVLALNAVTYAFAALVPLFLAVPSPKREDLHDEDGARKSMWADVAEGARYIFHRRPLLWLLGTFTIANFMMAPIDVFMPLLIRYNLAADWQPRGYTFETALAVLATTFGAGGIVGGALISLWGGLRRHRALGVVIPLLVMGVTMPFFGLTGRLYVAAAMAGVGGIMNPILNSHSQAIWQNQTPHELQGRVFSVRRLIGMCTLPLGTAVAGWAGAKFDPGHALALLGVLLTVFCAAQLFNRALMRVDDKKWLDSLAERAAERALERV